MRRSNFLHAKYEAAEFVLGNGMLAISGVFISPGTFNESTVIGVALVVTGVFLDYRVFHKSRYDRTDLNEKLKDTRDSLDEAILEMDEQQEKMNAAAKRLDQAMKDIDKQKREIQDIERKAFSFISRISSSKPIEQVLGDLEKKVDSAYDTLNRGLKEVESKLRMQSYRPYRIS